MNTREIKILCPRCEWQPQQSSRWSCLCRCEWNTFDTAGVCPQCGRAWTDTQCLACHGWSRHRLWYRESVGDALTREEEDADLLRV